MKQQQQQQQTHQLMHVLGGVTFPICEAIYPICFAKREQLRRERQYKNGILIITIKNK